MKVLFIINGLSNSGGSERVACNLANLFLEKLGYQISIISRTSERKDTYFLLNREVQYYHLSGGYFSFYLKLRSFLKNNHFDKIIVHNMGKLSFLCANLYLENLNMISLEHAAFSSYPKWIKILSKFWLPKFKTIITLTESDRLNYINIHNNVIKITNISDYNVNQQHFSYSLECKNIIAIGRLSYQKNFQALISAWELVTREIKDDNWVLSIYGDGEDKANLQKLINNNSIPRVYLCGTKYDLSSIYRNSAFLVMSSRYEGLGLVLIEAQSFGLPTISFDCPHGPSEIITHNKNGLLVENQNVTQLAAAILDLIQSTEKRISFSKNAKLAAKEYTYDNILVQWVEKVFNKEE